ncbi:hypothetical protein [Acidisphaera sp. L21]|uniref:hypothetical protein n=1 Tax=Acidisphaera sp. L21 TaxID=1641851 RepID=UPI00131DD482|nr:hypothetical protein [Acidisphaera sp. L21]
MTQDKLNDIWILLAANSIVWGWVGATHGDLQTLVLNERQLWSRRAVGGQQPGEWVEIPLALRDLSRVASTTGAR